MAVVFLTVPVGLINLQDKHRLTPHKNVPLLSPGTDKEKFDHIQS